MKYIKKFEAENSKIMKLSIDARKLDDEIIEFLNACFVDIQEIGNKYQTKFYMVGLRRYRMTVYAPSIMGGENVNFEELQKNLDTIKSKIELIDEGIDKVKTKYDDILYSVHSTSNNCYSVEITINPDRRPLIDDTDWEEDYDWEVDEMDRVMNR